MVKIRSVSKQDLPQLSKIYTEAYNIIKIGEHWNEPTALKLLNHLYKEQPDLFFVAEEDGILCGGIVSLVKPWWDGNHITDGELFVAPHQQGKGIGKRLIQHMFIAAQEQYQTISWDTFTHRVHEHPLTWYKSLGFEEITDWVMITGNIKKVLEKIT